MHKNKKIIGLLLTALMILGISTLASAQCTPFPNVGVLQYSNGSHPAASGMSIVIKDWTNSEQATHAQTGGSYSASDGTFMVELGNFQSCVAANHVLNLIVSDGIVSSANVNHTLTTTEKSDGQYNWGTVTLTSGPPVCGNNIVETGEQCDGTSSSACPGKCGTMGALSCQCPTQYGLSANPSSLSLTVAPNSSETTTVTVSGTGWDNQTGVTLAAGTVAGGNITFAFSTNNFALVSGASQAVTVNVSASNWTDEGSYSGTITITSTQGGSASVSVTISTSTAARRRKGLRYMDLSALGAVGNKTCVNQAVVITIKNTETGDEIKGADVNIYFKGEKINPANMMTDSNGQAKFTPTAEGDYTIEISRSGYHKETIVVKVSACGPVTTIAPTTVAPTTIAVTTVPETTIAPTTVAPTTVQPTTVAPTTVAPTTVKPTTVPVAPPAEKGLPWLLIIVVVVVLGIIVLLLTGKKKGGEGAPKAE